MKIFFSVGEPSGDLHGANLIRELHRRDPQIRCVGYGGPKMAEAGCELHEDLTALAVMWLARVLLNLHKFWNYVQRANHYFRDERPDAVVLIDYPGFNWWIARQAKRYGIPVFYYGTPQIWAWASWRVKKMRRLVDHALCKLPFEEAWLRERGVNATHVGHPYFDQLAVQTYDQAFLDAQAAQAGPLVTILPGSRTQEVESNLPMLLKAARLVRQQVPAVRFAIAAFKPKHAEMASQMVAKAGVPVEIHVGRTPELMRACQSAMACSGSVSLELLYHTRPTAILYSVSKFAYFLQGYFRRVKFITLVNLLAADELYPADFDVYDQDAGGGDDVLFPEYLTCQDKSLPLARHVIRWLTEPADYHKRVAELAALKARVAHGGASRTAAEYLLAHLAPGSHPLPAPHFAPAAAQRQTIR